MKRRGIRNRVLTFAVLALVFCALASATAYLPDIGDATSAPNTHVSDYYIEHGEEDTASPNIVSATLADYRGFDTMFETCVMFISGLVVTVLLVDERKKRGENKK